MLRGVGLVCLLALCVAAAAVAARADGAACPQNVANGLQPKGSAKQLITVVAPRESSTRGTLQLWRRAGACWVAAGGPWSAFLGQRGISADRREGDRTTPAGTFGIGSVMYGVAPDPGVRYRYQRVACGDWWVEDARSPFYNRFRHTPCGSRPPFRVVGGDLSRSPTAYRHFAFIRFNVDPVVPGRGSGIFLHASTGRPTLGCVSLPLPHLVTTLRWLRPDAKPLIAIGTPAMLRS